MTEHEYYVLKAYLIGAKAVYRQLLNQLKRTIAEETQLEVNQLGVYITRTLTNHLPEMAAEFPLGADEINRMAKDIWEALSALEDESERNSVCVGEVRWKDLV